MSPTEAKPATDKPPYTFWEALKDLVKWLCWVHLLLCLTNWSFAEGTRLFLELMGAIWSLILAGVQQVAHVIKTA